MKRRGNYPYQVVQNRQALDLEVRVGLDEHEAFRSLLVGRVLTQLLLANSTLLLHPLCMVHDACNHCSHIGIKVSARIRGHSALCRVLTLAGTILGRTLIGINHASAQR